jgi:AraC-like DNA-binding protein
MYNPVKEVPTLPFASKGHELDIFNATFATICDWGSPVLRNSFWRCYLPLTGGASVESSSHTWSFKENLVLVIPPDCPVRGNYSSPFTLYYIHFNCSLRLIVSNPITYNVDPAIRQSLDIAVLHRNVHQFDASVLQLVVSALTSVPEDNICGPQQDQRLDKALTLMKEDLSTRMSNAELANKLHLSEASLLRLFRNNGASSPQKAHLRLRLNYAAKLLHETNMSIDLIAEECGFVDRNHFSRSFSNEWKITPAKFRQSKTVL